MGTRPLLPTAAFWDFENVHAVLIKTRYGEDACSTANVAAREKVLQLDRLMDQINARGALMLNRAYADWRPMQRYREDLARYPLELIQVYHQGGRGKNGADIRLALDALEACYLHPQIRQVVVVAGDSDFIALAHKLKLRGIRVVGMGARESSSKQWIETCDDFEFIAPSREPSVDLPAASAAGKVGETSPPTVPKIVKSPAPAARVRQTTVVAAVSETKIGAAAAAASDSSPSLASFRQCVVATMTALVGETGSEEVNGSRLKSALLAQDPAFNERAFGFARFRRLLEACGDLLELQSSNAAMTVRLRNTTSKSEVDPQAATPLPVFSVAPLDVGSFEASGDDERPTHSEASDAANGWEPTVAELASQMRDQGQVADDLPKKSKEASVAEETIAAESAAEATGSEFSPGGWKFGDDQDAMDRRQAIDAAVCSYEEILRQRRLRLAPNPARLQIAERVWELFGATAGGILPSLQAVEEQTLLLMRDRGEPAEPDDIAAVVDWIYKARQFRLLGSEGVGLTAALSARAGTTAGREIFFRTLQRYLVRRIAGEAPRPLDAGALVRLLSDEQRFPAEQARRLIVEVVSEWDGEGDRAFPRSAPAAGSPATGASGTRRSTGKPSSPPTRSLFAVD